MGAWEYGSTGVGLECQRELHSKRQRSFTSLNQYNCLQIWNKRLSELLTIIDHRSGAIMTKRVIQSNYYRTALSIWLSVILVVLAASAGIAAGGYSHFYIARNAASTIAIDPRVPNDLRAALQTPEGLNAFSSGALAPDIGCIAERGHNNKSSVLPGQILKLAQTGMASAKAMSDKDPNKAAALRDSRRNLAFAYGWYSHVAADLNVHPIVNAFVGDSWSHNNLGDKAGHASQEVQLDYYVSKTLRGKNDKIDFQVPLDFLEKATGITAEELQAEIRILRMKVIAGIKWKEVASLDDSVLEKRWQAALDTSFTETVALVEKPESMKDWDLDVGGRMTTEEFERLRTAAMEANGGKLPSSFASHYIDWFRLTKDMPKDKLRAFMVGVIGKSGGSEILIAGSSKPLPVDKHAVFISCVKISGQSLWDNISVWANGVALSPDITVPVSPDSSGTVKFRAMVTRSFWVPSQDVDVLKNTPYFLHYWKMDKGRRETEYTQKVDFEEYTWELDSRRFNSPSNPYASGANPVVKNDCCDWSVPSNRTYEKKFRLKVTCHGQHSFAYNGKYSPSNVNSMNGSAELEIAVPIVK